MSRQITNKEVQVIQECSCGCTTVDQEIMQVRYADFKRLGIKIQKDADTGGRFLVQVIKCECDGLPHY